MTLGGAARAPDPGRPRVLTVAGVDPCGGAGLVADVRAIEAAGGFALAVPTCMTVQNRRGFDRATPIRLGDFTAMLRAAEDDGPIDAVKTGLFVAVETLAAFVEWFRALRSRPLLVVDPVLSATAGGGQGVVDACVAAFPELLGHGAVVTPNLPELQRLVAGDPAALLAMGARAVLVKGGHGGGDEVVDTLHEARAEARGFVRPRISRSGEVHGTGCVLASLLATRLALGESLTAAVQGAGDDLHRWFAVTSDQGSLPTPLGGR